MGTYVAENTAYPGADDRGSIPRLVANLKISVGWNNWGFGWYMRYVSAMIEGGFATALSSASVLKDSKVVVLRVSQFVQK